MSTQDKINRLESNEIFVFGSNLRGLHTGGSARLALDRFGAKMGIGEGLMGQSYAFPTLNKESQQRTKGELEDSIKKLIECAKQNTDKIFLLTKVGCGIAGYSISDIAPLFRNMPSNVVLPVEFEKFNRT